MQKNFRRTKKILSLEKFSPLEKKFPPPEKILSLEKFLNARKIFCRTKTLKAQILSQALLFPPRIV